MRTMREGNPPELCKHPSLVGLHIADTLSMCVGQAALVHQALEVPEGDGINLDVHASRGVLQAVDALRWALFDQHRVLTGTYREENEV